MNRLRRLVLLLLLLSGNAAAGELVAVVSAASTLPPLPANQVADIFLGQNPRFPDGTPAIPVDQAVGTRERDEFYLKVAAKTPPLMKAWWTKMVFTGRAQPPREFPNSAAVRRAVAANPGMIGYLDRGEVDATVRVVLVLP